MLPKFITDIESSLETYWAGRWCRLPSGELQSLHLEIWSWAWRLEILPGEVNCPGVNQLYIVIDTVFPNSQPRIVCPQAPKDFSWPHVEPEGVLCLEPTKIVAHPGERIRAHLNSALRLFQLQESERIDDFQQEFISYWNQRASTGKREVSIWSLLDPRAQNREIYFFDDRFKNRIMVGDDPQLLSKWLENFSGSEFRQKDFEKGRFVWLRRPWIPSEFPESGGHVLRYVPQDELEKILKPGLRIPILFGASLDSGTVMVATLLEGLSEKELCKGYRDISRVSKRRIQEVFSWRPARRIPVTRIDPSWIHGRDRNQHLTWLKEKSVTIIGCGALGSSIARMLAQSGVGRFLLVDSDKLNPHNISRHALGLSQIGNNKAQALASVLKLDFPHIREVRIFPVKFGSLQSKQLQELAESDLVLTAGIDLEGDAAVDSWRANLRTPPIHLCSWVEAFALAGHALALFGKDSLMSAFNSDEKFIHRLTEWPDTSATVIREAGCGNFFQPHGAVDLHSTVGLACSLALDILTERVSSSCRRVWMGNRERVAPLRGVVLPSFSDVQCIREYPW